MPHAHAVQICSSTPYRTSPRAFQHVVMLLSATFVLVSSAVHACTVSVHVMVTHTKYDYAIHAYIRTINAIEGTIHEHDPSEVWHWHVQKEKHYV